MRGRITSKLSHTFEEAITTPTLEWARGFEGGILVKTAFPGKPVFEFDVESGSFTPYQLDGIDQVYDVTGADRGRGILLAETSQGIVLREASTTASREWKINFHRRVREEEVILAGDVEHAVVMGMSAGWELKSGKLREIPGTDFPAIKGDYRPAYCGLLAGAKVYLGYAWSEWGGALTALDLERNSWSIFASTDATGETTTSSVEMSDCGTTLGILSCGRSLAMGRGGEMWSTFSIGWITLMDSMLFHSPDGVRWEIFSSSTNSPDEEECNWPFAPDLFQQVTIGPGDELYMTTSNLGLVVWRGGKWVHLTPEWDLDKMTREHLNESNRGFTFQTSGTATKDDYDWYMMDDVQAMVFSGGYAVIGTTHNMVVVNLQSGEMRIVPLPK